MSGSRSPLPGQGALVVPTPEENQNEFGDYDHRDGDNADPDGDDDDYGDNADSDGDDDDEVYQV